MHEPVGRAGGDEDGAPRYQRVQRALVARLVAGDYPVGSLLPTEHALAEEFGTSRFTVREALRKLAARGYIERRQGHGTRVLSAGPGPEFVQSFASLDALSQVAYETALELLSSSVVALTPEIAARVGGEAGAPWHRVRGVRRTGPGGRAICYIESWVPGRFGAVVAKFEGHRGPFFGLLEEETGLPVDAVDQEIRAAPMPRAVAQALGEPEGAWALQLLRRYATREGVLIASFNWHPADRMTYRMEIRRRPEG
jgi:DNA-binding GntR family transcriptional regulator